MNWRVFVLILGLGLWGSWGWGQCWPGPGKFDSTITRSIATIPQNISIESGDLHEFRGFDPEKVYQLSYIPYAKGIGIVPEFTIFDGCRRLYQYNNGACEYGATEFYPKIFFKPPSYDSQCNNVFYLYITNADAFGASCLESPLAFIAHLNIDVLSTIPIPFYPCNVPGGIVGLGGRVSSNVSDSTLSYSAARFNDLGKLSVVTERETGVGAGDLRLVAHDPCGNPMGFHPAPAFTNVDVQDPCKGFNNSLVMAFDPPANGYYEFDWNSMDTCNVEMSVFCDERLLSFERWFGYTESYGEWKDPRTQRDMWEAKNGSTGSIGNPMPTSFASPCAHQGAGNISRKGFERVCGKIGYQMSIDSVYYVVFRGDICCKFCVDVDFRYIGNSHDLRLNMDPVLSEIFYDRLVAYPTFLAGCTETFEDLYENRRISSHPLTPKSSTPITFTQATQTRLTLFSYTNATDPNTWNTIPATAQVEKGDSTHYTFNLQAGRQYLVQTDDDDPADLYRLKPKLTAPIPPTAPSPQSGKRRRRRQRSGGAVP